MLFTDSRQVVGRWRFVPLGTTTFPSRTTSFWTAPITGVFSLVTVESTVKNQRALNHASNGKIGFAAGASPGDGVSHMAKDAARKTKLKINLLVQEDFIYFGRTLRTALAKLADRFRDQDYGLSAFPFT